MFIPFNNIPKGQKRLSGREYLTTVILSVLFAALLINFSTWTIAIDKKYSSEPYQGSYVKYLWESILDVIEIAKRIF